MEKPRVLCLYCDCPIRDDDELIVVEHEGERESKLSRESSLADREKACQVFLVHTRCAPTGWAES